MLCQITQLEKRPFKKPGRKSVREETETIHPRVPVHACAHTSCVCLHESQEFNLDLLLEVASARMPEPPPATTQGGGIWSRVGAGTPAGLRSRIQNFQRVLPARPNITP